MLYDSEFLRQLDEHRTKVTYAKIIALTKNEDAIETIEGRVTEGSVSIDGDSSVRRTCSLTIVANTFNYQNYLWGLNTKFKLEIGVENVINSNYPSIIWFKQGTYFISSFNMSRSTNNFTISIQGKDKMCALNGEIGGMLTSSVTFDTIDEIDASGKIKRIKLPIKEIIKNIVHLQGGEPAHNIIINDLDMYGLELLEYRYDTPMYLYRKIDDTAFNNVTLDGQKTCMVEKEHTIDENGEVVVTKWYAYVDSEKKRQEYAEDAEQQPPEGLDFLVLDDLNTTELEMLVNPMTGSSNPTIVKIDNELYYIAKVSYGETAGYRFTDLTYAGDLIGNVGESLTSILDKIKGMLGDFEYFYDLDGQFIFQKKQTYLSLNWTPIVSYDKNNTYITDESAISYVFNNGLLVNAFNNNPDLGNVKNDYSVWGERLSVSGQPLPVHMRYAIDHKPSRYKSIAVNYGNTTINQQTGVVTFTPGSDYEILQDYNNKYKATVRGQTSVEYTTEKYDWRELIYQMACDYYKYAHILDDFELRIIEANPEMYTGQTGYENYYSDVSAFWRNLYNPTLQEINDKYNSILDNYRQNNNNLSDIVETRIPGIQAQIEEKKEEQSNATDAAEKETLQHAIDTLSANLSELLLTKQLIEYQQNNEYLPIINEYNNNEKIYNNYYHNENPEYANWNKSVYEAPETLDFWFDFLDSNGELSQYSVQSIGCRPKAINDSNVKAIYFRETPNVIFSNDIKKDKQESDAYTYINAQNTRADVMFTISSQGKSAKSMVDELMYMHSYCMESATITTVPIYYLQPNQRIRILDDDTNLNGYYVINKLTIPLSYSGTMSITATKAVENI